MKIANIALRIIVSMNRSGPLSFSRFGYPTTVNSLKGGEFVNLLAIKMMTSYLLGKLEELKSKHAMIGEVRGKGLFCGAELVADCETREPMDESVVQGIVADCMANSQVIIGATNRSLMGLNNTLCLSPALICTKSDLDEIIEAIDGALTRAAA